MKCVCVEGADREPVVLATFRLEGDRVIAQWESERYRQEVEQRGVLVPGPEGGVRLRLEDGLRFWQGLDTAYQADTLRWVETR